MGDMRIKAKVVGNTLVVEGVIDLEQGKVFEFDLVEPEAGFHLDETAQAALRESIAQAERGEVEDFEVVLKELEAQGL